MNERRDCLVIGKLYYYPALRRIYGRYTSNKQSSNEFIESIEPFVLLDVFYAARTVHVVRCKILSSKGIISYVDGNFDYIEKYNGESND